MSKDILVSIHYIREELFHMNDRLNKPTVAVIIPSYKCSETLHRAISSIVKQTRPVEEILVVDDCSPDGSKIKAIAESFPRVKYIRNEVNIGLAGSRNAGLFATNCEIVAFMDADDESHPQRIEIQLKYLTHNSVVTCDFMRIADKAKPEYIYYAKEKIKSNFSSYINALFNRITGAALMGETALLRNAGGYDQELRASEDLDLYLRLLNLGFTVKEVMLPLYVYHDTLGGLSKDKLYVWNSYVKVMDKFVTARFGGVSSWKAALFWFLVLFKEFVRAELIKNKALRQAVIGEVWRVSGFPPLKVLLLSFFKIFNRSSK